MAAAYVTRDVNLVESHLDVCQRFPKQGNVVAAGDHLALPWITRNALDAAY